MTPDKVFSNLPSLSSYYYPPTRRWTAGTSRMPTAPSVSRHQDTVFSGDEVTLIAKWRDYQYIIKYNVKYSDKNTTTGTMADQTAPFRPGCAADALRLQSGGAIPSPVGRRAATAAPSSMPTAPPSTAPSRRGDSWDDGSEDGETYNLYAVWTESKSPEQSEAEAKLEAAEKAIGGTYNVTYGKDTNALTMLRAKLEAAGITDVTVSMKEASYSSYNHVGITADGTIQYKWNENGSTPGGFRHRAAYAESADLQYLHQGVHRVPVQHSSGRGKGHGGSAYRGGPHQRA